LADPYQASLAQTHLNHVELFGKSLTVVPSKHAVVSLPQKESDLARDFSNSPLHRFKDSRSKNFRHICPPGPVLHIANLDDEVSGDELQSLFGSKVVAIQFFKTDRRMALVRMSSTAEAVSALLHLHNHKLRGKSIKVSFSPKKPSQVQESKEEVSESHEETQPAPRTQSSTRPSVPTASGPRSSGSSSRSSQVPASTRPSGSSQSRQPASQQVHSSQTRVVAPGPQPLRGAPPPVRFPPQSSYLYDYSYQKQG